MTNTLRTFCEYWTVTTHRRGECSMGHGFEFKTEKAALKVFDRTVALSPHGTRVCLNHKTKRVTTHIERKTKVTSISI